MAECFDRDGERLYAAGKISYLDLLKRRWSACGVSGLFKAAFGPGDPDTKTMMVGTIEFSRPATSVFDGWSMSDTLKRYAMKALFVALGLLMLFLLLRAFADRAAARVIA